MHSINASYKNTKRPLIHGIIMALTTKYRTIYLKSRLQSGAIKIIGYIVQQIYSYTIDRHMISILALCMIIGSTIADR